MPVLQAVYDHRIDISGVDLISVLSRARDTLPTVLGPLASPTQMASVTLPAARITGGNGVVAHELHSWPLAVQGRRVGLELLITDGMVMGARFGTSDGDGHGARR